MSNAPPVVTNLITRLVLHRPTLRRALLAAAVAVPVLAGVAAVVVDGWAARRFILFYSAPLFVALFLWIRLRLDEVEHAPPRALAVDAAAVALGFLRFTGGWLPFSGHMLFFTCSALTTRSGAYVALAVALAAETTWFKLALWRDPASWALGIATGAILALARRTLAAAPSPHPTAP